MEAPPSAPFAQKSQSQAATGLEARAQGKHRRYASPPTGKLGFVSATQISSGGETYSDVAKGDFNGDGKMDLVTIVETDNNGNSTFSLSIMLGYGDGTFQSPVLTTITDSSAGFVVGDVNGDGKDDILLLHTAGLFYATSSFDVLLSNGDGTFALGNNYTISPNSLQGGGLFATTDSGHLDVVAVDLPEDHFGDPTGLSNVVTVLGNGNGTFSTTPTSVALSGQVVNAVLADLNGDGILDVAGLDYTPIPPSEVTVYLATSISAFANSVAYNSDAGGEPSNLTVGDLNGDGYPEIVTSDCVQGDLSVFVNNGNGTYQNGVFYNPAVGGMAGWGGLCLSGGIAIADLNGDGKPDIISSNDASSDVTIFTGNGDGTVNMPTIGYAVGGNFPSASPVVADFNGDGYPDLVVTARGLSLVFLKGYGDGTFRAALDYYPPNGGCSSGIAPGDFNGDGIPDFVAGGTVFLSRPDGSLQPGVNYNSGCFVAVADFNHDGKLDFAATDGIGNVQIFTGKGDGTFTAGGVFGTGGNGSDDLVAADFNGDGYPDLAVINSNTSGSSSNVGVLLNDKTGNFQTAVSYPLSLGYTEQGIAAGDVNGDGKIDLVVPYNVSPVFPWGSGNSIAIFLGNGDGAFQAEQDVTVGPAPQAVAIADVNGDGISDIVVTLLNGGIGQDIAILLGTGTGSAWGYQAPTYLAGSVQDNHPVPEYLKVVDINGDGIPDLVYTSILFRTVGILLSAGSGSFYSPMEFLVGEAPMGLAIADVNGDGAPDVVVAGSFGGVTVLLNANGTATLANYMLVAKSASATVTAGSSANFTFTITPSNHYNGTVTFSCGTLPSLVACTFTPASVTPNGDTPVTVTLTISTTAPSTPSSAAIRRATVTPHRHSGKLLASIGVVGLFGLMFVGGWRKRTGWSGVGLGMSILAMLFWVACGSSSKNSAMNSGTRAGTYTVTVTATGTAGTNSGNTSAHRVNLTLTVQ